MILVDTGILIWYLRGNAKAALVLDSPEPLSISAVTYMELPQGCRIQREMAEIRSDFAGRGITIVAITDAISGLAVSLIERHALADGLRVADALTAGTTLAFRHTLVAANTRPFRPIAGLSIAPFGP